MTDRKRSSTSWKLNGGTRCDLGSRGRRAPVRKKVGFRRAIKKAMERTMAAGALGVKIRVSGRLGGAEIARVEWMKEGRVPLQHSARH